MSDRRSVPAYLSIKSPLRTTDGTSWATKIRRAVAHRNDDIVCLNRFEGISREEFKTARSRLLGVETLENVSDAKFRKLVSSSGDSWIAVRPEQIKSAIGNTGAFSADNPDICRANTA